MQDAMSYNRQPIKFASKGNCTIFCRQVKHKKRHKEGRANKHDGPSGDSNSKSGDERSGPADAPGDSQATHSADEPHQTDGHPLKNGSDSYSAIKERCLKQKLSISLRKLNATAYTRCDDSSGSGSPSAGSNSPASNSELDGSPDSAPESAPESATDGAPDGAAGAGIASSDTSVADGEVPDVPGGYPVMIRLSTQSVGSCLTGDGRTMEVGDVVWGKVHGFPWWPGKVSATRETLSYDFSAQDLLHLQA